MLWGSRTELAKRPGPLDAVQERIRDVDPAGDLRRLLGGDQGRHGERSSEQRGRVCV